MIEFYLIRVFFILNYYYCNLVYCIDFNHDTRLQVRTPSHHHFYMEIDTTLAILDEDCITIYTRGSHTSIPASIIKEVPRAFLPLGARIWRSSHSPRINCSRSPPSTLENWTWKSFLGEVFILHLTEFTLCIANSHFVGFLLHVLRRHSLPTQYKLVNPFSSFHFPCLPQQNGVSHILHAQGLPIGSLFLSPLSHSRRNLAPWRRCDYPYCMSRSRFFTTNVAKCLNLPINGLQGDLDNKGKLTSDGTWTYKPPTIDKFHKLSIELCNSPAHKARVFSSKGTSSDTIFQTSNQCISFRTHHFFYSKRKPFA